MTAQHVPAATRQWQPSDRNAGEFALLRVHDDRQGATILLRFAAGAISGRHGHPGGEELFLLQGACEVDGRRLEEGDFLYTPPGEDHDLVALEDTVMLLHLPRLPTFDFPVAG